MASRRIETKWDSFFADRVVELGALAEARRFGQGATGASADSSRANRARDGGIASKAAKFGSGSRSERHKLGPGRIPGRLAGRLAQRAHVISDLPDFIVGKTVTEAGHPGEANAILHHPKHFAIRHFLHAARTEVFDAGVHRFSDVGWASAVFAVAEGASHAVGPIACRNRRGIMGRRFGGYTSGTPAHVPFSEM